MYTLHMKTKSPRSVQSSVWAVRKSRGISQQELANAVGVSRQTIVSLEKGEFEPRISVAIGIAKYLGVPLDSLFWIQ